MLRISITYTSKVHLKVFLLKIPQFLQLQLFIQNSLYIYGEVRLAFLPAFLMVYVMLRRLKRTVISYQQIAEMSSSHQRQLGLVSNLDLISNLPQDAIDTILMHLPIKDAARTSILSRKWRYKWVTIPQIVFNQVSPNFKCSKTTQRKRVKIVDQVLLLHKGPIHMFTCFYYLPACPDINRWISFLSRQGIKELILEFSNSNSYRLPSLHLEPSETCNFTKVLNCLRNVENLKVNRYFLKVLASSGDVPERVSNTFDHLKNLYLAMSFEKSKEILVVLCMFRSSHNIQKLTVSVLPVSKSSSAQRTTNYWKAQEDMDCMLKHLQILEVKSISGVKPELEFIKVLLVNSPVLEKLIIRCSSTTNVKSKVMIMKELMRFRRASARAEIIYRG
ncbi:F-box/FBD/LRR-repeat protein At1g13570-like [Tasmannia lanceolata]|uniref:F-box/FBD/LRR-repeat protein At1g13570-like n=1 Tax=Tasmannia lanceolata TaxID=3420 RepID=UPI004064323B